MQDDRTTWRPIATAPQDGREALCFKPGEGMEVCIMDAAPEWWRQRGWTHWMPLPEPPEAE